MVCKIICCSELPDIPDKAGRKTRRRRTQTIALRYAFHANAIRENNASQKTTVRPTGNQFYYYLYKI